MTKQASTNELQNAISKNNAPAQQGGGKREVAFKGLKQKLHRSANELRKVLPASITPERIERVTLTATRKNPALLDCDTGSLLGAVFQAAQLGLQPDLLGTAYLVPFKGQVQLIIGYKGYIDLLYRSDRILTVQAVTVYENDHFKESKGSNPNLIHETAEGDRGEVKGYYAIVQLKGDKALWEYMKKEEVEAYRNKHSKDFIYKKSKGNENNSVWGQHFDSMAKKTVLKQLTTWLPISIEQKEFTAIDETVTKDIGEDPEYIDADFTVEEEAAE